MTSIYTAIEINAPKQKVWEVLLRKEQWKYWNTFLFDCDSKVPFREGQEVLLSLKRLPNEEETEFEPLVTRVQPSNCLSWISSIPGFRNESVFELQEIGVGRTKYFHKNYYSGIGRHVFLPFIREDERRGIQRMARELKHYLENW